MSWLTNEIQARFEAEANVMIALAQKAYMKGRFEFYGIKAPLRREIQKPYLMRANLPHKRDAFVAIAECWELPRRELQYFALDLAQKYMRQPEQDDIFLFENYMIRHSWWDTVDILATRLAANYFVHFPNQKYATARRWLASGNIWLQRAAIIFQLKFKTNTDTELLREAISSLAGSSEFFIQKAIGWALREYAYTDPDWVVNFVETTALSALSKREALRTF